LVLTIDATHGRRARDFERLLTQRNRLLRRSTPRRLGSMRFEAELAGRGRRRGARPGRDRDAPLRLDAQARADAPAFPAGRIGLAGDFDREIAGVSAAEAELRYRRALAGGRAADRAAAARLKAPTGVTST